MNARSLLFFFHILYAITFANVSLSKTFSHKDSLGEKQLYSQYAFYLPNAGKKDYLEYFKDLVNDNKIFKFVEVAEESKEPKKPKKPKKPKESKDLILIGADFLTDAKQSYAPPSLQMIHYFGRGLTKEQAQEIQGIENVLVINVSYQNDKVFNKIQEIQELLNSAASQFGAYIWDEDTREIFTREEFVSRRFYDPAKGIPDVSFHTVIHSYSNGEFVRAITLGMERFGLPDIVINDFPWSNNRSVGNVINLTTQLLAEGVRLDKNDYFSLDITLLKHQEYRESLSKNLYENAKQSARVQFKIAQSEQGDPDNLLLEPVFEHQDGSTKQQKLGLFLSDLFGSKDEIAYIKHNEAIKAASAAARQKLPALKAAFNTGFQPGEYLLLKAPFKTTDQGNEWMWVEVIEWQTQKIKGILKNEPYHIPELKAGATVVINQSEVFDYIRYSSDGSSEGNKTGELIQEFQSQ